MVLCTAELGEFFALRVFDDDALRLGQGDDRLNGRADLALGDEEGIGRPAAPEGFEDGVAPRCRVLLCGICRINAPNPL